MKIKVSDLTPRQLNYAVASLEFPAPDYDSEWIIYHLDPDPDDLWIWYTARWDQAGPIIEREGIGFFCNRTAEVGARFNPDAGADWRAFAFNKHGTHYFGPTPLIAAMRCYAASRLGEEVEVPDELA